MDSRQLHYFRTVVDYGSFTEAAAALHMTQPSLSLAVRRLEEEFGIRLLERSKQGVRPTEAGTYLHDSAVRILMQMDATADHLHGLAQGLIGRVVLSSAPTFNWGFLPRVLMALRRTSPDVEVVVQDPPPNMTIVRVLDGEADIGIVATGDVARLGQLHGAQLAMHVVVDLPLVAVLPPDYRSTSPKVSLADLQSEPWLVPAAHRNFPGLPEILDRVWNETPEFRPVRIQEISTLQTALPLVAGGMGVALMPSTVRRMTDQSVIIREVSDPVPPLRAIVLWRKNEPLSPAVERVVRLLVRADEWIHDVIGGSPVD